MADESHVIRGINWRETFPFTHIFRSFRVAIHPSKIALGVALLLTVYVGGRVLDTFWGPRTSAVPDELAAYDRWSSARPPEGRVKFSEVRDGLRKTVDQNYAQMLIRFEVEKDAGKAAEMAKTAQLAPEVRRKIRAERDKALETAKKNHDDAVKALDEQFKDKPKEKADALKQLEERYAKQVKGIYATAGRELEQVRQARGVGVFETWFDYQAQTLGLIVDGVMSGTWLAPNGVIQSLIKFLTVGPTWAMTQHTSYFVVFMVIFLAAWALFGGAICRIAALHIAREEGLSYQSALRFSLAKFIPFFLTPIIPLLFVLGIGLFVTLGGLLANAMGFGAILVGLLLFLALAAGFLMTITLLGTAGGFNLMYPTIAVEGSDSFDAISRSVSYVYARPWRMAFYSVVMIIYGAITFLFVRLFVYVTLYLTHAFAGWAVWVKAADGSNRFEAMWPTPQLWSLPFKINSEVLTGTQYVGAILIAFWAYLLIAAMGAYLISYYFSASTVIFYLMRQEVDATEMEDVYVEAPDEPFMEPAPLMSTPVAAMQTAAYPAIEPPPQSPPSNQPPTQG